MFCPFFFFHINFLHPCICEHCFQEFGVVSWNPVMWGMWSMNGIGGSLTPRLISLVRFDLITQVVLTGISLKDGGWIETCSCTVVVGGMPVPIELGKVFWGFREAKRRVKNKTKNKKKTICDSWCTVTITTLQVMVYGHDLEPCSMVWHLERQSDH